MINWLNKLLGWFGFEFKKITPPVQIDYAQDIPETPVIEDDPNVNVTVTTFTIEDYLKGDIENFTYEELMDFCSKANVEYLNQSILKTLKVLNNKNYKDRLFRLNLFKPLFNVPAPNNNDDQIDMSERLGILKSEPNHKNAKN
jgi:hypothetical protein